MKVERGEDPNEIPNKLIPYISKVAVGKLPELTAFGNDYPLPDGTFIRDYIHVVDLADGHIKALQKIDSLNEAGGYNLGRGAGSSVMEIIKVFKNVSGKKINYRIGSSRDGDYLNFMRMLLRLKLI